VPILQKNVCQYFRRTLLCCELCDVKDPAFFRKSAHRWRLDCQPHAPAVLYSPETFLF
jgi:hypothetical protein